MTKTAVLEFEAGGKIYAIRLDYVKAVFEIESVEKISGCPSYVLGMVRHGDQVYPLICTAYVLQIDKNICKNPYGKMALGLKTNKGLFAFIVDKIVQIKEIDKPVEDTVLNYYNEGNNVVTEISPQFLESRINIPYLSEFKADVVEEKKSAEEEEGNIYLVFKVGRLFVGIPAEEVKKVEELDPSKVVKLPGNSLVNRVYPIEGKVISLVDLGKLLEQEQAETNIAAIVGTNGREIALLVEDVVDMTVVAEEDISSGGGSKIFSGFFVYKDTVVSVLSKVFLTAVIKKFALQTKRRKTERKAAAEKDILVVRIGRKRFGIEMDKVLGILDYKDAKITPYPSDDPYAKGIVVTSTFNHVLYALHELLGEKVDEAKAKIVIFKDEDKEGAFLIDDVENLLHITEEKIRRATSLDFSAGGVVEDEDGKLISILNLKKRFSEIVK